MVSRRQPRSFLDRALSEEARLECAVDEYINGCRSEVEYPCCSILQMDVKQARLKHFNSSIHLAFRWNVTRLSILEHQSQRFIERREKQFG